MEIYPSKMKDEYMEKIPPKQNIYRDKSYRYSHNCIDLIDLDRLVYNSTLTSSRRIDFLVDIDRKHISRILRMICIDGSRNRAITSDISIRQNRKNIEFLFTYMLNKLHSISIKERSPFICRRSISKDNTMNYIWIRHYMATIYTGFYDNEKHNGRVIIRRTERVPKIDICKPKIGNNGYSITYRSNNDRNMVKDSRLMFGNIFRDSILKFDIKPFTSIIATVKEGYIKYHGTSV